MRELYEQVYERLSRLDFEAIYTGFHQFNFALYNMETVWLKDKEIPYDNRFLGNTSINYEGEQIAIWHVDHEPEDLDLFTAGMVHEMFHAFQFETKLITDFPNDLENLMYPDDVENYTLKFGENVFLVQALKAEGKMKSAIYKAFLECRKSRTEKLGIFSKQEDIIELLEGGAEFAGCMALKQLDEEKFNKKIQDYCCIIGEVRSELMDIRRIAYYSGTILNLVKRQLRDMNLEDCDEIKDMVEKVVEDKKSKIDDFLNKDTVLIEKDCMICGYDPMNQIRYGDRIFATHFVFLLIDEEPVQVDGSVLIYMQENSHNMVKAYRILK